MRDLAAVSWQPASSSLIQRRSCLTAVAVGNAARLPPDDDRSLVSTSEATLIAFTVAS